jgi:4-amino-4-deoxy-L-arabinose transferase-like glycosyltransferase
MKKIFLTILAVIGLFLVIYPRFYHLGSQPPGLHIDEVSFAADAKAIAGTGRDTWNKPWPLVFKAFGEWKAPGLTYSMAFWSKILGRMDTTIARLPSAIAGLSILIIYFLYP